MITETTPPKKQPQPNASLSSLTTMPIMIEPISPKTNTAQEKNVRIDSAELSPKDDDVLGCVEWALDISFLGEFSLSPSAFLLRPLSESFFKIKNE